MNYRNPRILVTALLCGALFGVGSLRGLAARQPTDPDPAAELERASDTIVIAATSTPSSISAGIADREAVSQCALVKAQTAQASVLCDRIQEINDLRKSVQSDSPVTPDPVAEKSESALQAWLNVQDAQARDLQVSGQYQEALWLREQIVSLALAAPPDQMPPNIESRYEYIERLCLLYEECGLETEAQKLGDALCRLKAPLPPTHLRIVS